MSNFHDLRLKDPLNQNLILRRDKTGVYTNCPHLVTHHSPTGFEWGYGGSGPADLALNVIEFALREMGYDGPKTKAWRGKCFVLSFELHQKFKWAFIATADRDYSEVPFETIRVWVLERMPALETEPQ